MATILNAETRAGFIARLRQLDEGKSPLWGKQDAPHLLAHLIDAFEVTFKEKDITVQRGFLATRFGRWLVLRLPIPRGKITAPPMFHETEPGDFEQDRERVITYIERFATASPDDMGPSPVFGHMNLKQWGHLHTVHLEHHLRQFGC